ARWTGFEGLKTTSPALHDNDRRAPNRFLDAPPPEKFPDDAKAGPLLPLHFSHWRLARGADRDVRFPNLLCPKSQFSRRALESFLHHPGASLYRSHPVDTPNRPPLRRNYHDCLGRRKHRIAL